MDDDDEVTHWTDADDQVTWWVDMFGTLLLCWLLLGPVAIAATLALEEFNVMLVLLVAYFVTIMGLLVAVDD